ncbi:MAG: hypothetical protein B6I20_02400 [Bacteroidetes bacterium 4572_117]|nr:MAG: hypothetical protein B6I20_02400 [Bacteroidetes bacterium 4572_117]
MNPQIKLIKLIVKFIVILHFNTLVRKVLFNSKAKNMDSLLKVIKILVFVVFAVGFISCDDSGNNSEDIFDDNIDQGFIKEVESQTYYLIPSPEGLFSFIRDGDLKYVKDILNPTDNMDKYIDTRAKELNFGIYSADLAYVSSFNKYQESVDYLNTVRTLSDEIGISAVFDENLIGRIDNIIDDQDSLLKVTSDSYFSIVRYLESSNRKKSLALIVTGGWIESIFVVTNLVDTYKEGSDVVQLLADQKLVVSNLMSYLDQNKSDDNIQRTINDLKNLQKIYENLGTEETDESKLETVDSNKIVVGGSSRIIMTSEQFFALKLEIGKVRNKITKNN